MSVSPLSEEVECPFCGEDGLDVDWLKAHLLSGFCGQFNDCDQTKTPACWTEDPCSPEARDDDDEDIQSLMDRDRE